MKQDLFADNDDEDDVQGDGGSRKQEQAGSDFLKVYKKNSGEPEKEQEEEGGIKDGQVKFKRDAPEEERDLKMPGGEQANQPVIQELSSTVFSDQKGAAGAAA